MPSSESKLEGAAPPGTSLDLQKIDGIRKYCLITFPQGVRVQKRICPRGWSRKD